MAEKTPLERLQARLEERKAHGLDSGRDLMLRTLETAVPLWAAIAREWTPARQLGEAERCGDIIACGSDVLFRADETYSPADRRLPTVVDLTRDQMDAGVKARLLRDALHRIAERHFDADGRGTFIGVQVHVEKETGQ